MIDCIQCNNDSSIHKRALQLYNLFTSLLIETLRCWWQIVNITTPLELHGKFTGRGVVYIPLLKIAVVQRCCISILIKPSA